MKLNLILSLLLLPAMLPAQQQALSEQESRLLQDCIDNVDLDKKLLSPDTAEKCVDGLEGREDLMSRASSAYPKATAILLYNNALLGLKKVVARYSESDLGYALVRELEGRDCYSCLLGIGPRPEKLFPWVDRYLPERSVTSRRALRTWDALGDSRRSSLQAEGMQQDAWNEQDIKTRYAKLSALAEKDARQLLSVSKKNLLKTPGLVAMVEEIKQDLLVNKPRPPDAYKLRGDLDKLLLDVEVARGEAQKPAGQSAAENKARQLQAAKERLAAARGDAAKKGFLDSAFDNYVPGAAAPPVSLLGAISGKYRAIPPEDMKQLSERMLSSKDGKLTGLIADEMAGTRAGDEITAFYNTPRASGQNELNFAFEETKENFNGVCYYREKPEIRINEKMVYDYARRHNISPTDILSSKEHMSGLAAYLAPTFVHEATHQRQETLEREKFPGLRRDAGQFRSIERETESFSMGAAFTAEKMQRGAAKYVKYANPYYVRDAELYMEGGVEPLRARKHTFDSYSKAHHVDESATARLLAYSAMNERKAAELKKKRDADPDSLTPQEKADLARYLEYQKQAYAAAAYRRQKSIADERKLIAWRDEMLAEDSEGVKSSVVPPPSATPN